MEPRNDSNNVALSKIGRSFSASGRINLPETKPEVRDENTLILALYMSLNNVTAREIGEVLDSRDDMQKLRVMGDRAHKAVGVMKFLAFFNSKIREDKLRRALINAQHYVNSPDASWMESAKRIYADRTGHELE